MSDEDWPDLIATAFRNMALPPAQRRRPTRWLDRLPVIGALRAAGRRRRARRIASAFPDEETREWAVRVLAFLEKVRGSPIEPAELDTELRIVLRPIISSEGAFWHALELAAERGHPGRDHVVANLRNGTVRHLVVHLSVCKTCRAVRDRGAWRG